MNYVRLDELDLAVDPRTVSEGSADGVHWTIRAEGDDAGVLSTVVTYTCHGVAATFSVLGASLHNGQLLSMWVGRERDARSFLLLRTAPVVTHATAVLASGARHEVELSPVVEDFRLRFGGVPLAADDPLVSVELAGPPAGLQVVDLWRPPRMAPPVTGPAKPARAKPAPAKPAPAKPAPAKPAPGQGPVRAEWMTRHLSCISMTRHGGHHRNEQDRNHHGSRSPAARRAVEPARIRPGARTGR